MTLQNKLHYLDQFSQDCISLEIPYTWPLVPVCGKRPYTAIQQQANTAAIDRLTNRVDRIAVQQQANTLGDRASGIKRPKAISTPKSASSIRLLALFDIPFWYIINFVCCRTSAKIHDNVCLSYNSISRSPKKSAGYPYYAMP